MAETGGALAGLKEVPKMRSMIGTMCIAVTLGAVGMASAQPVGPLPTVCTAGDARQADRAVSEATKLLLAGDADAYVEAVQQLEKALTPACRMALIERDHQPTRPTGLGQRFLNDLLQIFLPESGTRA